MSKPKHNYPFQYYITFTLECLSFSVYHYIVQRQVLLGLSLVSSFTNSMTELTIVTTLQTVIVHPLTIYQLEFDVT